jgi:hypothetical protein
VLSPNHSYQNKNPSVIKLKDLRKVEEGGKSSNFHADIEAIVNARVLIENIRNL